MADIDRQRASAKSTISNLITVHRMTIADIDQGKRFFKRGRDVTSEVKRRCEFEIEQCRMVYEAVDNMRAGAIARAAELCSRIQEQIPSTH